MTDSIEDRILAPEQALQRVELQRLANVRGSDLYHITCDTKLPYNQLTMSAKGESNYYCPLCETDFEKIKSK
jgi:hypothetical protein